jgi:hypothetical protein
MLGHSSTPLHGCGAVAAASVLAKSGVIVLIAIQTNAPTLVSALRAPEERLGSYTFLNKLQAGLRSDVWLGLPPGGDALDQVVALKVFFPHAGEALDGLEEELALAQQLSHPNVALALRTGRDEDRPFIVSEYLEGATLRSLLGRSRVAGARLPDAAVARVLVALAQAVAHAERKASSVLAKVLVNQVVAADDVFVTFEGDVKLLGFKGHLGSAGALQASSEADDRDASSYAAVDALLSEHLSPALGAVLARARRPAGVQQLNGLVHLGRSIAAWQKRALGSDGRAELAALMATTFPAARQEQSERLGARFEQVMNARSTAPLGDDDSPPQSGVRRIQPEKPLTGRTV